MGNKTSVSHPNGAIGLEWDDRGLLTEVTGGGGAAGFSYDDAGRLASRTDTSGTMNVTWTDRGEVDTIFDPVSGVTFDYEWTASSLVDSVTTGTGLVRDYSYDTAGRVTADVLSNTAGVVSTMGYGYDTGSNMVTKVVGIPGNPGFGTHTYTYDLADRLESWTHGANTIAYGYDLSGNRVQAGSDVYSFDARNRLTSGPEGSYSHTARGTLTSVIGAETHTYDFDSLDRLVAFDSVAYTYDGLDRVATRGTDTFTYSGLAIDPTSDGQFTYGRTPGGNLLSITDGTETVLVGRDRHGDVTHLYNQTGVIQHSRLYDPFGEVTTTAGTQVGLVGFQGDWTDPSSEHVWMGARWYDGGWATFLSRDTVFGELSTSVSLNRYTYAFNNPLSFWDPDGRCPDYLGSINGGTALAQCKAHQAEMTVRMQAQSQTTQKSAGRRSSLSFEGMFDRMISALTSPAKTPEPASAFVREAAAPPGRLVYDPFVGARVWRPYRSFGDHMRGLATGLLNLPVGAANAVVLAPATAVTNVLGCGGRDLISLASGDGWHSCTQVDFTVGPVDPFGTEHTAGVAERSHQAGEIIGAVAGLTALAKTGVTKISSFIKGRKATSLVDDAARAADDVARNSVTASNRWTQSSFGGNRVYQRNDLIDPALADRWGRSNLERMQLGRAPIGPDANPINLHHVLQTESGGIAEVTATMHQKLTRILHINPSSIPSGIDRGAFNSWREAYWMARAKDFS